jgi:hypothetical protein
MSEIKHRLLSEIAYEIERDWGPKMNYAARPYWAALCVLETINDKYYLDSAREIVARFLCNAGQWRGPIAREIKTELKQIAGIK